MMRRPLMGVLLVVMACPKAPPKVQPPPPLEPRVEVRRLIERLYATLEAGDPDPARSALSADVMAFGLAPSDTFAEREAVLNSVRQQLLPIGLGNATLRIRSGRIDVGLSSGGRSAWFWDLPRVEWETSAKTSTWLVRVTGHAIREDEQWRVDAVHVSLAVPDERIFAPDAATKYLPPADVLAERGPDADQLIGLARRTLDDLQVKFDRVSERQEVAHIGTGPTELIETGQTFKALVRPLLPSLKKTAISYRIEGPMRARLAPGKRTGWVAANIVLRQGTGKKAVTAPPFRVLWVFVEERGLWNLATEHQSLAVKDELRIAATADDLKAFETIDALRRARTDVREASSPALPAGERDPNPRVIQSSDGGLSTFD